MSEGTPEAIVAAETTPTIPTPPPPPSEAPELTVGLCFVVPKTAVLGGVTLALTKLGSDPSPSPSPPPPTSQSPQPQLQPPQPQQQQQPSQPKGRIKVFSVGLVIAPQSAEGSLYVLDSSAPATSGTEAAALSATTQRIDGSIARAPGGFVTFTVERSALGQCVRDPDLLAALLAATADRPLALQPVWGFGQPIAHAGEEPEAGTGWVFSWRTSMRSISRGFGLQMWGYAFNHPQRVVAFHPTFRGIVTPLLEIPAMSRDALEFLAWVSVAEATPGYDHALWYASLLRKPVPIFRRPLPRGEMPEIVAECIEFLAARAAVVPGMFRIAQPPGVLQPLIEAYDNRPPTSTPAGSAARESALAGADPHAVAALLKTYLRELPEPLVPWDLCLELGGSSGGNLEALLKKLPPANAMVLSALVELARRVAAEAATSLMDARNLATCLAPAITRKHPPTETSVAEELAQIADIIAALTKLFTPQH